MGAPFGLKGFVKVKPLSGETGHFSRLRKVTLRQGKKDETWELAETIIQGDSLIVRFAGVESPEAAALLKGAELIAERKFAAPLKEGEFYVEDLKGLEVIDGGGETLGHISNVMEGGGAFLAEVKLSSGDTSLVPFRNEFFGEVNLDLGKIVLLEPWILE